MRLTFCFICHELQAGAAVSGNPYIHFRSRKRRSPLHMRQPVFSKHQRDGPEPGSGGATDGGCASAAAAAAAANGRWCVLTNQLSTTGNWDGSGAFFACLSPGFPVGTCTHMANATRLLVRTLSPADLFSLDPSLLLPWNPARFLKAKVIVEPLHRMDCTRAVECAVAEFYWHS
mmetsp:Transcript_4418/g.7090  ORF Transcript_4418/g.7090 Transcript_4418/m.7090 type:complete len:174 (+) Transcript_4418:1338-1859(+)|eukprot:CAMPEP_0174386982 /NCGR_PEP_ID=MMETSP0811_2-20130205/127657_1 /TAXON_ID=73025 ORGANISM="Eutreptiella gymnastica-like, Strain CCMP1594" /NCGR_SAMPLE_ID=MMETSP0811_2 /ASSEMBLY_ACC=CAM_ASM_000667 /LENGTH=173 /DNA_ID=CAMNT_0015541865 /DNA_START=721 /DNA_END=1242 /DNA_ORIENTATION=-